MIVDSCVINSAVPSQQPPDTSQPVRQNTQHLSELGLVPDGPDDDLPQPSLNALSAPPSNNRPFVDCSVSAAASERGACGGACGGGGDSGICPLCVEVPDEDMIGLYGLGDNLKWSDVEEEKKMSCCYVADDMAGDNQRAEKYIVDIPYSVLLSIYQSLDADKGWEALAAESGYTFDKIKLLELEGARNQGSPSRSLLWELGSRNTTVRQLYCRLQGLNRYREMKILEDYVHSQSTPSFMDNGLIGLPDAQFDSSNLMKGQKTLSSKKSCTSTCSSNSMVSKSLNSKQMTSSDVNISMKCQKSDKHYPGKEMPFLAPSNPLSSPLRSRTEAPSGPSSVLSPPAIRPSNPGSPVIPGSSNVNLVQNMIRQIPGESSGSGSRSSSSSSGAGLSQLHTSSATSPSSSSSPHCDSPFSSSVSSLPGLESSFDVRMAFMGSASFSFAEIVQATNNFSDQNKLGEGAFGAVYLGVLRKNKCAVKKMAEASGQETVVERSTQIKRELTSLLKFRHENIVTLYGYAVDGESLCLVYQFMPNGSLEDRLMCKKNTPPLIWAQRLNILLGACQGLNFLHTMGDQPLIHGDIKSANILLDKHLEAKIGDLGQAQQANGREADSSTSRHTHITRAQATTKLYGTRAYQSREVQTGGRPSTKSDIFAMGVVFLEVFSGEQAYDERREGEHFLGDYFRSMKGEDGDEACLRKVDGRGGECAQEVLLAILSVADACTAIIKRKRPDSAQLLQRMTDADQLYREKTGIKHFGMDSLAGSEHSCHVSYTSSAGASGANLTAAPPQGAHLPAPQHNACSPVTKPNNISVNVNQDQPGPEKHYAMHLHHEPKPDNCLMVNINTNAGQKTPDTSSLSPNRSPIDYFQKGQQLPPAFRLQKAYDSQSEAEKRRISRLSQCPATNSGVVQAEVLPQPDPAKLAALEQFDRQNFHARDDEKESNIFQSDPNKLAALKQFDQGTTAQARTLEEVPTQHQACTQDDSLVSDPKKLAQLKLFDHSNMNTVQDGQAASQEEWQMLASDPNKLAALSQFDATDSKTGLSSMTSTASQPTNVKSAMMRTEEGHCTANSSLVSQVDFVVNSQREALEACTSMRQQQQSDPPLSSQREALEACSSMHQQQQSDPPLSSQREALEACTSMRQQQQSDPSLTSLESLRMQPGAVSDPYQTRSQAAAAVTESTLSEGVPPAAHTSCQEALKLRQQDFFDKYYKALAEANDGEDDFYEDEYKGEADYENEIVEESENNVYQTPTNFQAGYSMEQGRVQDEVSMSRVEGHCHPVPSEQDECMLNYFKQREQHYEKTFTKPQASQC